MGYSPWGCKQWDMTERLHFTSIHSVTLWATGPPIGGFPLLEGRSVNKDSKSLPEFQI